MLVEVMAACDVVLEVFALQGRGTIYVFLLITVNTLSCKYQRLPDLVVRAVFT